ncbi:hypothetical protein AWH56_021925 [Anaerobacillus isosaccharinicus]|uniref:Uncharacterized protein n=1 Tax=Anaerobacillus isosaccharinicus TaxID=1532552 RepID=A0A1S2L0U7_9BACI|nr:hypothetical protein [Anaerobacillus isosaccharinicus]MBA5586437.1 hypothetical protein [Anaerobacillus isosaccharinicus]QOY35320.1 hypothetical protein AWH56_021925 [Anaerobacillus isosaccharinicus]
MKISKEDYLEFKNWCKKFFRENREGSTKQLVEELINVNPKLIKRMEKAVGKGNVKAYLGRSLMTSLRKEGWLWYEKNTWVTKPNWGLCTHCFCEIDDIYLIDIDGNQYCNDDCFEEHGATEYYDSYNDDYFYLFSEFKQLKEKYTIFLEKKVQPNYMNHLELKQVLAEILEVLNDDIYSTVWLNGGDDGPVSYEIARMLQILQRDYEDLNKEDTMIKAKRQSVNQLYSITINRTLLKKRRKPEILKQFIQKHRKYRSKTDTNRWTTKDLNMRNNWYEKLNNELSDGISYCNEIFCPACQEVTDRKWARMLADGYYYCHECADEWKKS